MLKTFSQANFSAAPTASRAIVELRYCDEKQEALRVCYVRHLHANPVKIDVEIQAIWETMCLPCQVYIVKD